MDVQKVCPNCGQYKFVSQRLYLAITGIVMIGCGVPLLILLPIGVGLILFGIVALIASVFAKGRVCTNCKFKTVRA